MPGPLSPQFWFNGNYLLIEEERQTTAIRAWPDPTATRRPAGGLWSPFAPAFPLVLVETGWSASGDSADIPSQPATSDGHRYLLPLSSRARAFQALRESLPASVAAGLSGFHSRQWQLLVLCHRSADFIEFLHSNPVLAYYLTLHWAFHLPSSTALDRTLTLKLRELAGALGFAASESAVRILRKVDPAALNRQRASGLQAAMACTRRCRALSHLSRIHEGVLELLFPDPVFQSTSPSLLREVSEDPTEIESGPSALLLRDVLRLRSARGETSPVRPVKSRAELRRLHLHESTAYRHWLAAKQPKARGTFPKPPLPGIPGIEPIETSSDLRSEGDQQHNCVASYAHVIRKGETYIYRVLSPERCTLSIVRDEAGNWVRGELKRSFNRDPRPATIATIDAWLEGYRVGA